MVEDWRRWNPTDGMIVELGNEQQCPWERMCFGDETRVQTPGLSLPSPVTESNLLIAFPRTPCLPAGLLVMTGNCTQGCPGATPSTQVVKRMLLSFRKHVIVERGRLWSQVSGVSETFHALTCLCNHGPSHLFLKNNY